MTTRFAKTMVSSWSERPWPNKMYCWAEHYEHGAKWGSFRAVVFAALVTLAETAMSLWPHRHKPIFDGKNLEGNSLFSCVWCFRSVDGPAK